VPERIEEAKKEKLQNAQSELNQSIKELTFSDSTINIVEIQRLIEAKEIEIDEKYPLNIQGVITVAQQSFVEDRFLPIVTRKHLFQKLEELKKDIPVKDSQDTNSEKAGNTKSWISWISSIGALLTAILGLYSMFLKGKEDRERQEELSNELQNVEASDSLTEYAYQFEKRIIDFLRTADFVSGTTEIQNERDNGIDFEFKIGEKNIYLYIKYYRKSKVGLKGIFPLLDAISNKKGEAWLVYSSDLTSMVRNRIEEFNKTHSDIKIKTINISSSEEFEQKVKEIIQTT